MGIKFIIPLLLVLGTTMRITAQGGMGPGMMRQGGMMGSPDALIDCPACNREYMRVFHSLLNANEKIKRSVTNTASGIESFTWSDDPEIAKIIKEHVDNMKELMDGCAKGSCPATPRWWDPVFAEVYKNADKIHLESTTTDNGVKAVETGDTDYTKRVVQAHAAVLTKFVENGWDEMHKEHTVSK